MADENREGESMTPKMKAGWTPEQLVQAFKEIVTAILGVLVIAFTLYFAVETFNYAGSEKITDAKDVLQVLLGVAGVVIGYYFGRVPADSRAALAQEQANVATAKTEQTSARTQTLADQVDKVIENITPQAAAAHGLSASSPNAIIDLQRIRDELRTLATLSGRHG